MKIKSILLIAIAIMTSVAAEAIEPADEIIGTYEFAEPETGVGSKIRIYKLTDGTYQGRVVWIAKDRDEKGNLYLDINNPNPKLRTVPCNQVIMLRNFTYDSKKGEWSGGEIYNPANGKTYKAYMKFESKTKLKVRGYIGVPALGQSMYWTKIS